MQKDLGEDFPYKSKQQMEENQHKIGVLYCSSTILNGQLSGSGLTLLLWLLSLSNNNNNNKSGGGEHEEIFTKKYRLDYVDLNSWQTKCVLELYRIAVFKGNPFHLFRSMIAGNYLNCWRKLYIFKIMYISCSSLSYRVFSFSKKCLGNPINFVEIC